MKQLETYKKAVLEVLNAPFGGLRGDDAGGTALAEYEREVLRQAQARGGV